MNKWQNFCVFVKDEEPVAIQVKSFTMIEMKKLRESGGENADVHKQETLPFLVVGTLNKFTWDLRLVNTKGSKLIIIPWIEIMVNMFENNDNKNFNCNRNCTRC